MPNDSNFSDIHLSHSEIRILKKARKHHIPVSSAPRLIRLGFLSEDSKHIPGYKGKPTGFAQITERGVDFLHYHSGVIMRLVWIPILVALITSVLTNVAILLLQQLWPMIQEQVSRILG